MKKAHKMSHDYRGSSRDVTDNVVVCLGGRKRWAPMRHSLKHGPVCVFYGCLKANIDICLFPQCFRAVCLLLQRHLLCLVQYTVLRCDLLTAFRHVSVSTSQLFMMNSSGLSEAHSQGTTENGG